MKKISLNLVWSTLIIVLTSFGMALTLKADIGTGSINALSVSIAAITGIHVGTVLMAVNICFVLVQWAVLRREFHWRSWLQVGVSIILGIVVNFVIYLLFKDWQITHYAMRLVLFIVGTIIACFGIALILKLNLIVFPVEGSAVVIANKTGLTFKWVRQLIDFIAIVGAVVLTVIFQLEWSVREGTILNFLILPYLAQFFIDLVEKLGWFQNLRID